MGVEECGNGFQDDFFHGAVFSGVAEVPAGGGFEFDGVGFGGGEEGEDFGIAGDGGEVSVGLESGVSGCLRDDRECA